MPKTHIGTPLDLRWELPTYWILFSLGRKLLFASLYHCKIVLWQLKFTEKIQVRLCQLPSNPEIQECLIKIILLPTALVRPLKLLLGPSYIVLTSCIKQHGSTV